MSPNEPNKRKSKQGNQSPDLLQEVNQEGTLSLAEIANLGISAEEYEQDQYARQSLALARVLIKSQPVESSSSTGRPSALENLGISHENFESDGREKEAIVQDQALAIAKHPQLPPPSLQAGLSRRTEPSISTPGFLSALGEHLSHPSTPRIRIDQDPLGILESCDKENQQPPKASMASNSDPMEGIEGTGRILKQEALADSEPFVPSTKDLPPQYEEDSFQVYQVVTRPVSQVHPGSYYSYSHLRHHEGGPKQEILDLLWEALFKLDVNMEVVQMLEDETGFW